MRCKWKWHIKSSVTDLQLVLVDMQEQLEVEQTFIFASRYFCPLDTGSHKHLYWHPYKPESCTYQNAWTQTRVFFMFCFQHKSQMQNRTYWIRSSQQNVCQWPQYLIQQWNRSELGNLMIPPTHLHFIPTSSHNILQGWGRGIVAEGRGERYSVQWK
jgi:hypothetical protein